MFKQADQLIKDKQIAQAADLLFDITELEPTFGKAYNHLGWIFETQYQEFAEAEKYYKLALEHAPDYLAVYYNYAILLSTLKRFDELSTLLNNALKVEGINTATIHNEFGIMYELQGKYDQAIASFQTAIKNCIDSNVIKTYQDSIARCQSKQTDLAGNRKSDY